MNTEQAEFWAEMAPTWVELDELLEEVGGPPGRLAMDRVGLRPDDRVLDLGCGTGATTVELAERIGPGGRVVGVDISQGMLDAAAARAERLGVRNVEFRHADVQVEDLGGAAYEAAFSRFGVMFFADPVAAFANVRRALVAGGILSFACWQGVFENEWMLVPGIAAMSVTGTVPPMPGPDEPGPFSLCDPERVRSLLGAAGFEDLDVTVHQDHVVATEDRIPVLAATSSRVGAVREVLREADDQTCRQVVEAVQGAFQERVEDGELHLTRGVLLVRAKAPSL